MDRIERMLLGLNKDMTLVEVGPSHNPIVPKSSGWNTVIVDYADATFLREHYKNENHARIEDVDVIWRSGQMHEAFLVMRFRATTRSYRAIRLNICRTPSGSCCLARS